MSCCKFLAEIRTLYLLLLKRCQVCWQCWRTSCRWVSIKGLLGFHCPHQRRLVCARLWRLLRCSQLRYVRNIDLYREHNDLLFSFVRSLVSTLDAKDPYTRGHSERVALIGRRLGAELGLPEEELKTIHLSGLLHDIGKIGVNESILRKNGPLNDDEFQQIQRHPMIGFNILSGLKNLRHVLPGVRSHHENVDGSGYPDQLAGDDIPLLARILAVADGYDAMGSDRPYRKGMPIEKIEAIFSRGSGRQWDSAVIDAYFRCRTDVLQICGDYSLEQGAPLETVSLS